MSVPTSALPGEVFGARIEFGRGLGWRIGLGPHLSGNSCFISAVVVLVRGMPIAEIAIVTEKSENNVFSNVCLQYFQEAGIMFSGCCGTEL